MEEKKENKYSFKTDANFWTVLFSTFIVAAVSITALIITNKAANRQFELEVMRYNRDSTNSINQLEFLESQIIIMTRQYELDSTVESLKLKIIEKQLALVERDDRINKIFYWSRLWNTINKLLDLTTNIKGKGFADFDTLTVEEQQGISEKILELLISEIDNPLLIENSVYFEAWRSALFFTRRINDLTFAFDHPYSYYLNQIMGNVVKVWEIKIPK